MNLCASRYAIALAALAFMGISSSQSLAAAVPRNLAGILAPALSRANGVIRMRQPSDATGTQIDALIVKQATALQRLKGAILGRTAVATFVVNNVVNDTISGGYDVEGTIVLPQRRFYNRAARMGIKAAHSAYAKTLAGIAKTDYNDEFTHPRRQKSKDKRTALAQLRQAVAHINQLVAPPPQKVVLHTVLPEVAEWKPGQVRKVLGRTIYLHVHAENYFGINHSKIYPDSSDTANGGDCVSCIIYMHWIAEINSHAAKAAKLAASLRRGAVGSGKAIPTVYLTSLMQPALYKATKIIRERQAPNATEVQIAALNARQGAALARFKGKLLGKKVVALIVVGNVFSDTRNGGYDVYGNLQFR